jgi:ATP-dependent Clp protease adaptor protein ClpS
LSLIQYDPATRKIGASNRRKKVVEAVQAGVTEMAPANLHFGVPDRHVVASQWTEGRVVDKTRRAALSADDDDGESGNGSDSGSGVSAKVLTKTKRPSMYRVLILNDDYTPMEFVVHILERFFNKGREEATQIMLHVHHHGVGECGVFTYEVAETKVTQVMDFARRHQHPLQCVMEKK